MDTVSYSKDEKIRLLEANGYVVRKGKVAVIENNIPSVSKESFAFKAGRKYNIDTVFDSTVKSIMLMINPGGGEEEDEGGFYTAGLGIDITGAVISVSHLGFENLVDPGADKIMVWDNTAGALVWDEITLTSKIKVSSNDTTPGYLEDKLALSYGANAAQILELSTILEGANEVRVLQMDETKISHDSIADVSVDDHHSETHTLATTGAHTDSLPLIDLAPGTAGDIITRQAADWAVLAKGTATYILKMGATYPAWGQVAWGELTGTPTTFAGYGISDTLANLNTAISDADLYSQSAIDTWRSSVTAEEMGWLHGITSDVQTQITARAIIGANPADNRLCTWSSATTIQGEANLTFDGSKLTVNNTIDVVDGTNILKLQPNDIIFNRSAGASYIKQIGTQSLSIMVNDGTEVAASFNPNSAVELYYNNVKKLETTAAGVSVTGSVSTSQHVNITGSLYLVTDSAAIDFTGGNAQIYHNSTSGFWIRNYVNGGSITLTGYDAGGINRYLIRGDPDNNVELYYAGTEKLRTTSTGITITGNIKGSAASYLDIHMNTVDTSDTKCIRIGGGGDVLNTRGAFVSFYGNENAAFPGDLILDSGVTGEVYIKRAGTTKLETTSTGVTVTGNITATGALTVSSHIYQGDSDYHYFGADNDAAIYHTGIGFYIKGYLHGGPIYIRGESTAGVERGLVHADPDGAVTLFYAGGVKFITTNTGIDITGGLTATGTIQGANYKSGDGTLGITTTVSVVGDICDDSGTIKKRTRTLTIKDGLITSIGTLSSPSILDSCPV